MPLVSGKLVKSVRWLFTDDSYWSSLPSYAGKLISFNCKLCECKFSDPNAKEMHMKGRKHRLQFKKKVDPKLKVEMKPNNFKHKRNEKWKKQEKQKDVKRKDFRSVEIVFVALWWILMTRLMEIRSRIFVWKYRLLIRDFWIIFCKCDIPLYAIFFVNMMILMTRLTNRRYRFRTTIDFSIWKYWRLMRIGTFYLCIYFLIKWAFRRISFHCIRDENWWRGWDST